MIAAGVKAKITCVDPSKLADHLRVVILTRRSWKTCRAGIDPCGENGEFHTFVHAAPVFSSPIPVVSGEIVERDGFVFADVVPA